jgi:hypothetical protein
MTVTNSNSEIIIPEYYYRVQECGIRFIADGIPPERFRTDLDFKCDDLLEGRAAAECWYLNRLLEGNEARSLTLNLVEQLGDKNFIEEYYLLGEDEETVTEGREHELMVLKGRGFNDVPKYV